MSRSRYAITDIVQMFRAGKFGAERLELIGMFDNEIRTNKALRLLLGEICAESAANNQQPTLAMGTAMMYGMVLGSLLEQDAQRRKKGLQ